MKKKILFIIPNLDHGGTNRSLQNMLSLLDSNKYDFFIFSVSRDGVYRNIFSVYNIIDTPSYIFTFCKSRNPIIRLIRCLDRFFYNAILKFIFAYFAKDVEALYGFDKVIAFEEGYPKTLAICFNAPKIAWVHCDYESYNETFKPNLKKEFSIYVKFDYIVCVSKYTAHTFRKFFPCLSNKTIGIYNTLNVNTIMSLSNNGIDEDFDTTPFVIVSVGRFDPVKRFDIIPYLANEVCKKSKVTNFKWYIIGDGRKEIRQRILGEIIKYKLEEIVILLGTKENPYPYIKRSNLLVSTSSSEACPYVVNEAKILHTPVLVSDFKSAFELVNDDNGIISNISQMPSIIYELICDKDGKYSHLSEKVKQTIYTNDSIIEHLDKILL